MVEQPESEVQPTPEPPPAEQPIVMSSAPVYQERRSEALRAVMGCGVVIVILILIIGVLPTIVGLNVFNSALNGLITLVQPPVVARVDSTQTIITGIQPLGQLVSVSAQLAKADIDIGVRAGNLNACGFSASHVAQGTIEGGVDLTQIGEDNVTYNAVTDTYTLRLPAPQLTSCRIDFIRQYLRSTTVCNVDWDEARLLAGYVALTDFRDDALEGGVLDRAELEARVALTNFVEALTGSQVTLVFDAPQETVLPPSCVPEIPEGWAYDETAGTWVKS